MNVIYSYADKLTKPRTWLKKTESSKPKLFTCLHSVAPQQRMRCFVNGTLNAVPYADFEVGANLQRTGEAGCGIQIQTWKFFN